MNLTARELSGGEKAALAKGYEVNTEEQFAVCYLIAKDLGSRLRMNGMSDNFSVESGMKPETYRRAVKKFGLLISGQMAEEVNYDEEESIYPKLLNCFNKFENMDTNDLIAIARNSFSSEAKEKGKIFFDEEEAKKFKYHAKAKNEQSVKEANIKLKVNSLVAGLSKVKSLHEARKQAVKMVAKENGVKVEEINRLFKFD